MSRRLRRTKIACTMGPSTDRGNNLEKIIAAGANVVRMNFLTVHRKTISVVRNVREIAKKLAKLLLF